MERGYKLAGIFFLIACGTVISAEKSLQILLPLGRTVYQTNEFIDVTVIRSSGEKNKLNLALQGEDGSRCEFVFPVSSGSPVDHFRLNGYLLRPGKYDVEVSCEGAKDSKKIELFSHIRQSSFKTIAWGSYADKQQLEVLGENGMGFNMVLGNHFGKKNLPGNAEFAIRGGFDFMQACTMGGMHQVDGRTECDWSDPYVLGGGIARASRQAFLTRLYPNGIGVHLYDEPGLTWWNHPETKTWTPHNIPAQDKAYKAAFNRDPMQYYKIEGDNSEHVEQWEHQGKWKLSFMEAVCKQTVFSTGYVRPDFLTITQSGYGWFAFSDGYSFNVTRGMPLISGHGGYDIMAGGYFSPSFFYEFSRVRDMARPNWYLPTWYQETPPDAFRLEQYLTFMMNAQGLSTPPLIMMYEPKKIPASEAVVESNKVMARLGSIFEHLRFRRPEVGVLYSINNELRRQSRDMTHNLGDAARMLRIYLATKLSHISFQPIADEDVMDGTLADTCKALIMTGIDYLPDEEIKMLEAFIQSGSIVLMTDDCDVEINGARKIGPVDISIEKKMQEIASNEKLDQDEKLAETKKLDTTGSFLKASAPLAKALSAELGKAGIKTPFECDRPEVVISKQGSGDIEYYFMVNASYDYDKGAKHSLKPVQANVKLPNGKYYDAVLGGAADLKASSGGMENTFRLGAGAMKVFARTSYPIRGVDIIKPLVMRDFTVEKDPIRVVLKAALIGENSEIISGSAPFRISVADPLGHIRYDLYRASNQGVLELELPLAANDPSGTWKVIVTDMLSGKKAQEQFELSRLRQCGAAAGKIHRAMYFGDDLEKIFRFFRVHKEVTLVPGRSDFNQAAVKRLENILSPWGIRLKTMSLDEAAKSRTIKKEEAPTWCGLDFAVAGTIKPGDDNPPVFTGFAVEGPVILLGNPEDNPVIDFLNQQGFLPYKPKENFIPGSGRGFIAWQMDGAGYYNQESITLIAYDEEGMSEAVGTMYEAAAGHNPATKLEQASFNLTSPAVNFQRIPLPEVIWETQVPDRVVAIAAEKDKIEVFSFDGSITKLDNKGRVVSVEVKPPAAPTDRFTISPEHAAIADKTGIRYSLPKFASDWQKLTAIAYWGGHLKIVDKNGKICMEKNFENDIGGLAEYGEILVVGTADGRVLALKQ